MTMTNLEYLQAYVEWKDKVNTEDVDTPERFDAYLQDQENARILEHTREEFSSVMDKLVGKEPLSPDTVRRLFVPVAEALLLNYTWWVPDNVAAKLAPKAVESGKE